MTLGKTIKYLREQKGITQEKLAKSLNVIRGTLSNWEIDHAIPDIETIKKIAEFFNVSTDYLLGRSDKKNPGRIPNEPPEWDGLNEEERKKSLEYIRFLKSQRGNDEQAASSGR